MSFKYVVLKYLAFKRVVMRRPISAWICKIGTSSGGAVLIEFAIVANLLILINILAYDFALYYRLSEQAKHGSQFVHTLLANDADHRLTLSELGQAVAYIQSVTHEKDFTTKHAVMLTDAMPYYDPAASKWRFVVCWSWSSNPILAPPPPIGSALSGDDYRVDTWVPSNGLVAGSAILIVTTLMKNDYVFSISMLPDTTRVTIIGPVRYAPSQPANLLLYSSLGGGLLNDNKIRDVNLSNAIVCQR